MGELRKRIEGLIAEAEKAAEGRHMNDGEYSRHCTLCEVLEIMDELEG